MCLSTIGITAKPLGNVFANAREIIVGNFTQNVENEITNAIRIDSAP